MHCDIVSLTSLLCILSVHMIIITLLFMRVVVTVFINDSDNIKIKSIIYYISHNFVITAGMTNQTFTQWKSSQYIHIHCIFVRSFIFLLPFIFLLHFIIYDFIYYFFFFFSYCIYLFNSLLEFLSRPSVVCCVSELIYRPVIYYHKSPNKALSFYGKWFPMLFEKRERKKWKKKNKKICGSGLFTSGV